MNEKLIDELLGEARTPEELFGKGGLLKQLTKSLVERILDRELVGHLGYEKYDKLVKTKGNYRNGSSKKTVHGDHGSLELKIPRDRDGSFEPLMVPKGETRLPGFVISNITDLVTEEVKAWQNRPLESLYPIVYLDALRVKVREDGRIHNKAIYLILGIDLHGQKNILGIWISKNEGAKFWLSILTDLKNRGVSDVFIVCCDGLSGFPEAIETAFPKAQVQLCIVHMIRNSLKYVSYRNYKEVCADLKNIYRSPTEEEGMKQLENFGDKWEGKYPSISQMWLRNWDNIATLFAYPDEIRKVIYTTNPLESVNRSIRKIIKNRGSFPHDDSLNKLLYLAIQNISKKWTMPIRNWKSALNRFAIMFEERMPQNY
ncbi:MAG: IS256 family transposase [Planctomycetota bacterium]